MWKEFKEFIAKGNVVSLAVGLMMGVAMEFITRHTLVSPEARLLVTTGFLGGLTTFSTFSAEVTTLLVRREWIWSLLTIGLHVVGSVALTIVGLLAARALFTWGQP